MTSIDIYRGNELLAAIKPDAVSTQVKKIMGENEITLIFRENRKIPFMINDHCVVFGEKYLLAQEPAVKKIGTYMYEYNLLMKAEGLVWLSRAQFLFLGADNTLRESNFSLMGNSDDFVNLVIENVNRIGGGFTKGEVIPTDYKNLTFSKENCYNALSRISEAFGTEFWIRGKTIHLAKKQKDTGYTFKHGRHKGLYEITRQQIDNTSVVTRLYAFGSEKNLPGDYRDYSKRLRMTDGDYYIEKNVAKYGIIEHTEIFEDIYPRRTGKVTAVNAVDPFVFVDATIDFNVNDQLLPGISAKVVFNTGQLAGYEFEVSSFNNTTKTFRILKNKNERVLDIPSSTLKPAIGDEYVLIDIRMPDIYIEQAEARLKEQATALLDQISEPQLAYQVVIDPVFMKTKGLQLNIGDLVWIVDNELEIDRRIRIVQVTRNIVNEYQYQVELSDTVAAGTISTIINAQATNGRDISQLNQSLQNNSILNGKVIGTLIFDDIPTTNDTTGFSQLYIEDATGKIFKKV